MFNRYFQEELTFLRELGEEFSKAHPALAPMLKEPTTDPDVERLLEGVAFLSGLMRQKLDDEFPEIIHGLIHLIWPHYLRPVPSTTIIAFKPKPTLKEPFTIPAGIYVNSIPIERTTCSFKTSYEVEIHPLNLIEASFVQSPGKPPFIRLLLELDAIKLSDWTPGALRFFLGGEYHFAADIYMLLRYYLKNIYITSHHKGHSCILSPDFLKPVGFSNKEAVIPYPPQSFPGFRIIQEFFILPQKFLFLDLYGWEKWENRGDNQRFEIQFELEEIPFRQPKIKKENFVLFATPAVNIFPYDADPVRLDHRQTEYLVTPSSSSIEHYQIYSVDKVVAFVQGTAQEKVYTQFEAFDPNPKLNPTYHTVYRHSRVGEGFNVYLSVAYPQDTSPDEEEILSIKLSCTNGFLAENLQQTDISLPTSSTPVLVEFTNILPPTPYTLPPLGTDLLWRLISNLSLNFHSLLGSDNLKALLELYIFINIRNQKSLLANKKRIEGIKHAEAGRSARLVSGIMMRGQDIRLKLRQDHFASQGDLYLFGSVLDHFLGCYASINSYTQLFIEEVLEEKIYKWPTRLGEHPLI